jgi:transcriptional regulator with XRE-family HTH domain
MSFGERLKAYRLSKGLYQKELGELLGTDEFTVINWEKGKCRPARRFWTLIREVAGLEVYK